MVLDRKCGVYVNCFVRVCEETKRAMDICILRGGVPDKLSMYVKAFCWCVCM